MAAKNKPSKRFERILFPTDFSAVSVNAAAYALMTARQHRAKLIVLHVVDTSTEPVGTYVPHVSFEGLEAEMTSAAAGMLRRFTEKSFRGFKEIETETVAGEPYKEILKVIKKAKVDLVVMGASGKAGLDRFIFGSTTERVMRRVDCPILIIPPAK
ncbi:MAG: universal stress protein [Deltaproteobacteria bacterium]|nr:universal stress protein [Deltaproteobacteria bacterium]